MAASIKLTMDSRWSRTWSKWWTSAPRLRRSMPLSWKNSLRRSGNYLAICTRMSIRSMSWWSWLPKPIVPHIFTDSQGTGFFIDYNTWLLSDVALNQQERIKKARSERKRVFDECITKAKEFEKETWDKGFFGASKQQSGFAKQFSIAQKSWATTDKQYRQAKSKYDQVCHELI